MKKFTVMIMAAVLMLGMAACSTGNKDGNADAASVTPPPDLITQGADPSPGQEEGSGPGDSVTPAAEKHIVVLDPGHGGGYSGAAHDGLVEKELSLKIAFYIKEYLEENYDQLEVYLTRETDTALSGDIVKDLEMRAQFAEEKGADVLVSLHLNASESHNMTGSMGFISNRSQVNEDSRKLADKILEKLSELGLSNEGSRTRDSNDMFDEDGKALDYYAINRHCAARGIPGIIIEHCFMDNADDQKYINSEDMLKSVAIADAEGIAGYFFDAD